MEHNLIQSCTKPVRFMMMAVGMLMLTQCQSQPPSETSDPVVIQTAVPLTRGSAENPLPVVSTTSAGTPQDGVPDDQWTQAQSSRGAASVINTAPTLPQAPEAPTAQPAVFTPPKPAFPTDYQPGKAKPFRWVKAPNAAYSILATEVTVAQFFACITAGICKTDTITPTSDFGPTCNYGRKDAGNHPINCINYLGAEQVCTFAQGRICTDQEWLSACAGPQGRAFPYGDQFDLTRCNMQSESSKVEGRPLETAPVQSYKMCTGGIEGLWDMSGNVNEWVNGCKGNYCKFLGGGYLGNDPVHHFNSCSGVCAGNQKEFSSATIGVRCCRDDG
ncbi:MAG: SUMF1/EgtB/PvdO family nonheme iron enzyme [Myxococcales bacterium]|nr:SUMF1/EgtB/PvdO family nonheme iron enzyme [Myxococcales bacterium]